MHLLRRAIAAVMSIAACAAVAAQSFPLSELTRATHFHGIAVDPADSSRLYLATHHGLFVVSPDGSAARVSADGNDYMGFTPHPSEPGRLFASGHPSSGGNLGFIASDDGGATWTMLSPGLGGPVDFHQMDVSKADPLVIYGAHRGIQRSTDGGRTWARVGPAPDGLIDLAASAADPARLYAATEGGLLRSDDGGLGWRRVHPAPAPVSLVQTGFAGEVYAYVLGVGLVRAAEAGLDWEIVHREFGEQFPLHLAVDPADASRLFAVMRGGGIAASVDGGASWRALGG